VILDKIVASKRRELAECRHLTPLSELRARVADVPPAKDFAGALSGDRGNSVRLIAEFKRASPSKGVIRPDLTPDEVARFYEDAGASAMSVLTDGPFFQGHLDDLRLVRKTVSLPLLRKDFTLEAYQIVEARCAGADAILLIAAILTADELRHLREEAEALGMAALVEVHNEEELDRALASEPKIVGVNNRDLKTFTVDLETTFRLSDAMPDNIIRISESGIRTREDVVRLQARRIDAMLVGETCMRRESPADAVRELLGVG
jgi:indole-3-glycerol phosphate synthase